jgi:nucleoid-associated protein YgaU
MTAASIGRIAGPFLALVTACGAVLAFGIAQIWHKPTIETSAATTAPAVSPPAPGARDEGSVAVARAEANSVAAALAASARSPDTDGSAPIFDIARIEPTGDAIIAGRAAPGAIVELWGNGERYDRAVADQSGHFVMIPPRLPPGDYKLTLTSRQSDGKQATSKQSVVVALQSLKERPIVALMTSDAALRSRAEEPFNVPQSIAASRSGPDRSVASSRAHQSNRRGIAALAKPDAYAATPLSGAAASPSVLAVPKGATAVVSRGDSLWRISRVTYGAGVQYSVIYQANRDQIRNPNRIYPGQIFILPESLTEN